MEDPGGLKGGVYVEVNELTSIKSLFQSMIPDSTGVVLGKVLSASPLKIQVINDDKLILTEGITIVSKHLSDYTTECDLTLDKGKLDSKTKKIPPGPYELESFNIHKAALKIYNALKPGETVYLLSFNEGKKYYVLDREV